MDHCCGDVAELCQCTMAQATCMVHHAGLNRATMLRLPSLLQAVLLVIAAAASGVHGLGLNQGAANAVSIGADVQDVTSEMSDRESRRGLLRQWRRHPKKKVAVAVSHGDSDAHTYYGNVHADADSHSLAVNKHGAAIAVSGADADAHTFYGHARADADADAIAIAKKGPAVAVSDADSTAYSYHGPATAKSSASSVAVSV